MENLKTLKKKAVECFNSRQFEKAAEHYLKILQNEPDNASIYFDLGDTYYQLDMYDNAMGAYNKAIELNPKVSDFYNGLGNVYYELKDYSNSIDNYKKAIEINSDLKEAYRGLALSYRKLKNHESAIKYGLKGIDLDSEYVDVYYILGQSYYELEDYENALLYLNKVSEINPTYSNSYYVKGLIYYTIGKYAKSKKEYENYIISTDNSEEYFTQKALSKISEINKLLANAKLTKVKESINKLINQVQGLLLYNGKCVTHYTGLSVTKSLILEASSFRLSEGAFLNDTSEGKELFAYVNFHKHPQSLKGTEAVTYTQKPFIGSFVAENKHDDLTLWRMYGKENKDEAKGCAITLDRENFIKKIKENIILDIDSLITDSGFNFYRVAYRENAESKFTIPGDNESEAKLNRLMSQLKKQIESFNRNKGKEDSDIQNVEELLNRISYNFKSGEYKYEHELRLIIDGAGFLKNYDDSNNANPPRVYINLVTVRDSIEKLTIGPKVERSDEWAAAFYYSLEKDRTPPEILISHLPYK
jgi:Tfp pilus assembly protein PilF